MSRSTFAARLSQSEHLVALAGYTLIALGMSYPLAAQFGDHFAGVDGDVWSYVWAMGWARVALLNLAVNPFHTDYVFYPLGGATQLLWGTALPSFASIPLQLAFGLVPAFNLMYFAATVLSAYGMYLLGVEILTHVVRRAPHGRAVRRAAFIIGLVFAFSALRLGYGLAFTNLFHTEFIPFFVLFLLRATQRRDWKNAILAGFFFALNVYVDFQIAAFLALLTGMWFVFFLARDLARKHENLPRETLSRSIPRWGLLIATAGILSLPMLAFVLQDFSIEGGNYIRVFPLRYSAERSYDVLSFFLPNARSTVYQNFAPRVEGVNASVNTEGDSELSPDRQAFLGVTALLLALGGVIRFPRSMLFWIAVTLVFAVLSLGPVLHAAGYNTNIPLPFALANSIPIVNHIRIPMRYGVMVFFGAALLAGGGAMRLLAWKKWLMLPLGALILLEAGIFPYPTLQFQVPRVYEQIARDADDVTVLEIPSFNWRFAAKNEIYQTVHQKRLLRAYTNRIAPDIADYFNLRQTPIVVRSLRILEGAERGILTKEEREQDRTVLNATLNFFRVRYAVLHRDQLDAERVSQIDAYLRDVLKANAFYQDDRVTAYQLAPASDALPLALDFADNANLMYLGRGWQIEPLADVNGERGRFVKRAAGDIYFVRALSTSSDVMLRVLNAGATKPIAFALNGQNVVTNALEAGWQAILVNLPPSLSNQMNLLQIQVNQAPASIAVGSLESRK